MLWGELKEKPPQLDGKRDVLIFASETEGLSRGRQAGVPFGSETKNYKHFVRIVNQITTYTYHSRAGVETVYSENI